MVYRKKPKPGETVLVMRATTERPEAVKAGTVKLVGTDTRKIVDEISSLIESPDYYEKNGQGTKSIW